jgi:hypothetical protein
LNPAEPTVISAATTPSVCVCWRKDVLIRCHGACRPAFGPHASAVGAKPVVPLTATRTGQVCAEVRVLF